METLSKKLKYNVKDAKDIWNVLYKMYILSKWNRGWGIGPMRGGGKTACLILAWTPGQICPGFIVRPRRGGRGEGAERSRNTRDLTRKRFLNIKSEGWVMPFPQFKTNLKVYPRVNPNTWGIISPWLTQTPRSSLKHVTIFLKKSAKKWKPSVLLNA